MTVADANPTNWQNAQQIVTDAIFESLMPLYCALPENSGVGCVTNRVQWKIITYDTNGNSMITGCAASGCQYHYCGESGAGMAPPPLAIVPSTTNIGLRWPSNAANFVLEASSNLANWYAITPAAITNGGQISVQIPASGERLFYRLHHN
jgi:hypothetical protein